jgi:hypothetical protein
MRRDLLEGKSAAERKRHPLYSGVVGYFRDALLRIARVSYDGNEQHNPGEALHWARGKSMDHLDCVARHMAEVDVNDFSDETEVALAAMAWRGLAQLQIYLENKYGITPPPRCR